MKSLYERVRDQLLAEHQGSGPAASVTLERMSNEELLTAISNRLEEMFTEQETRLGRSTRPL